MSKRPLPQLVGYDRWKTTNPADEYLGSAEQRTPWHPGWSASEDTRIVDCDCCEGAGQIEEYPPRPTPQGPYARVGKCGACNGSGEIEIEQEPIEEEDLGP